jgi:hypothetical protein
MYLGLSQDEFWNMTLVEFNALADTYRDALEREDRHFGLICAVMANINRDPKKPAYQVEDFIPQKAKPKAKPAISGPAEFLKTMRILNAAMGGTEVIKHGD